MNEKDLIINISNVDPKKVEKFIASRPEYVFHTEKAEIGGYVEQTLLVGRLREQVAVPEEEIL